MEPALQFFGHSNATFLMPFRVTSCATGWLLGLAAWFLLLEGRPLAQESIRGPRFSTDPDDKRMCERQLNILTGALRQYRKQNGGKLPDKLSDLHPDYIQDDKVLTCPFVLKRGGLRTWRKDFRQLCIDAYTSYSYEFPPDPLEHGEWRGVPRKTFRDYKERQVEEVGPAVPIVRCHDHRPWLNLALSGHIYETDQLNWESNFPTNESLRTVAKMFAIPPPGPFVAADFQPRDPQASARLLDLTRYYNAKLADSWQGFGGNHLASLPIGKREFDGVQFDVRGVIQLSGTELPAGFPRYVEGIEVRQKCTRIHFLHALSFPYRVGTPQASYAIHYAGGETNEFRVISGQHIADWWCDPKKPAPPSEAKVAWIGQNEAAKAYGMTSIRLYHAVWENPLKDTEIETISFDALVKEFHAGPFVVAITLE